MSKPGSAEKSFKFKKIAIIAFGLMTFDAFIFGIPSLGLTVLFLIVCASGISAFISLFRDKKYAKLYAIKAAIYLIALMGILGIFKFNSYMGANNAEAIIKAVNKYYADSGVYPENLNQLVPIYLERIPGCAYRMTDRAFRYFSDQGDPNLLWTVLPPFSRRIYYFKDAEWRTLD
ncbi:MAG: hypothetical protein PVG06_03705 [Desulfobacterales bacterium]|jgi:hypothetical protein